LETNFLGKYSCVRNNPGYILTREYMTYRSLSTDRRKDSRGLGMAEHIASIGRNRHVCRIWGRRRWVNNIKMDLKEIGWDGMDWIELGRDQWRALVNTVMKLLVP
jgi:hypothetical protein